MSIDQVRILNQFYLAVGSMSRFLRLCFKHDRSIKRETAPPCLDLDIDVRVPWSLLDAPRGGVSDFYCPACPVCKESLHYVAWSSEDEDYEGSE